MPASKRDDFTSTTRRTLAERVACRCSFPGCGTITVGPNSKDPTKSINNGIAAHIHAAASNGPRYKNDITRDDRRHITNGIWMCRHHGNLVDADFTEYSPDTLRNWKSATERRAAESLKLPSYEEFPDGSTLIQLGSRNIFHATWKETSHRKWSFTLIRPELGSLASLRDYVSCLDPDTEHDAYVVVESQGDARRISDVFLRKSNSGQQILEVVVQSRILPTDPNALGADFKIGDDGDLSPDFAIIRGTEAANQMIMITMGVAKGEIKRAKDVGSFASEYFAKYSNNLTMLSRLLKMELIRLSLIPVSIGFAKDTSKPSLDFVKRFVDVSISSAELSGGRLPVSVSLEWGNGEYWSGNVPIFISLCKPT